jgi:hypothetical protein
MLVHANVACFRRSRRDRIWNIRLLPIAQLGIANRAPASIRSNETGRYLAGRFSSIRRIRRGFAGYPPKTGSASYQKAVGAMTTGLFGSGPDFWLLVQNTVRQ